MGLRATDEEVGEVPTRQAFLSPLYLPKVPPMLRLPGYRDYMGISTIDSTRSTFDSTRSTTDSTQSTIDSTRSTIILRTLRGEFAILLANSNAALDALLYDPMHPGQWVFLAAPTSRDHLMTFDMQSRFCTSMPTCQLERGKLQENL